MTVGYGMPRDRLYVALDFLSIKVPAFKVEYIEHEVTAIVDERFGSEWDKEIYRIYPGEGKQELMGRMRWSRGEKKVKMWRSPKHNGRRAPEDWDYWIRRHALGWCLRERDAKPESTVCVLVSSGGDFRNMVRLLLRNSVEVVGHWMGRREQRHHESRWAGKASL